jgi:O-antigen/teichoic acid export membrane protein
VAVNGSEVLLYFPAAVQTALTPALARVDQSIRHDQALRTFRILMLTTIASVVAAAIVGPRLLPLLFGARFDGSVAPFLWLLPGAIGFATSKIFNSALLASASAGRYSMSAIAALVVGILLDLMLIPQYGAVGAAAAASGAFVAGGVVAMLLYRSRSPFHWRSLVPGITDVATVGSLLTQLAGELGPAVRVRRLRSDAK